MNQAKDDIKPFPPDEYVTRKEETRRKRMMQMRITAEEE